MALGKFSRNSAPLERPLRAFRAHRKSVGLSVSALSALAVGVCACAVFVGNATPTFRAVRESYQPSDAWILDRNGEPLESIRVGHANRSLDWVEARDVSPAFKSLLIVSEDRRFRSHHGVDLLALTQASRRRGASTLTMQLANQIEKIRHPHARTESLHRKIDQIFEALRLDHAWTKDQIFEAYVNLIPFRGELTGLRAASVGLFAKSPRSLDEIESAILVAMIRSPNARAEQVARRACGLLKTTDCSTIESRTVQALSAPYRLSRERTHLPILSKSIVSQDSEKTLTGSVQTTLDARIQDLAMSTVREQLRELKEKNVGDAAVVVMKTSTGEILAYVGNGGPGFATASQIDGVRMLRQAGSTLKPFVYGTAYEMNLLTTNALVEDSPEDMAVGGGGIYSPKNYDHDFHGFVSAAEALGSSLNVPAVRTLELVKEARVLKNMASLGFTQLESDDHYGPSLALGTVDVSLLELTNAYRQLSLFSPTHVFSDETKRQIFESLSLQENRRYTFGVDSLLALAFPAAVKTGTSKDMRDNWCIGYTSEYTVGVWVGNFNGQSMWNVSGMTGAAPIWHRLMVALHASPPRDLPAVYHQPNEPLSRPMLTRIRYPQSNMLVGLDPDIPKRNQKLSIQIEHPQTSHVIFVDGHRFARADQVVFWDLRKGRHEVELRDARGSKIDGVSFVVR